MLQGWESEFSLIVLLIVLHICGTQRCACVCACVCLCMSVCVPVSVSVSLSQGFQSLNPITSSNLQPSRERERTALEPGALAKEREPRELAPRSGEATPHTRSKHASKQASEQACKQANFQEQRLSRTH